MDKFFTLCAILMALVILALPILAIVKPKIFSSIEIGPIEFSGEKGVRIGGGITLGIYFIIALCCGFPYIKDYCCYYRPRMPQLRLPQIRANNRNNQNITANESSTELDNLQVQNQ